MRKAINSSHRLLKKLVGLRMKGSVAVATVMFGVALVLVLLMLFDLNADLEKQKESFERAQQVTNIEVAQLQLVNSVLDYNWTGNLNLLKDYQKAVEDTNQAIAAFNPSIQEQPIYATLVQYLTNLDDVLKQMRELYDNSQEKEAIFLWRTKGSPLAASSRTIAQEMLRDELEQASSEYDAAVEHSKSSSWLITGLAAFTLLFLTLLLNWRAENALQAERDFALQIMNTMGQGLTVVDRSFRYTYINAAFARMAGFSEKELKGKNSFEFLPEEAGVNLRHSIKNPLELSNRTELVLTRKDQTQLYSEMTTVALLRGSEVTGLISVFSDLTQHKKAQDELRQGQKRLQALSEALVKAQENERRKIARELHDEIGQAITAIKINLKNLQRITEPDQLGPSLEESINIVNYTLQQVRSLSLDLRPPMLDELGLVAALQWYLDGISRRANLLPHLEIDSSLNLRLPSEIETVCFRVTQEALTNIVRHAQAKEVWIELKIIDSNLDLTIQDDGIGFDVKKALERAVNGSSMGLLGMQERVSLLKGELEFSSSPDFGSCIHVSFPLDDEMLASVKASMKDNLKGNLDPLQLPEVAMLNPGV
ncbi:MAG TPA: PAS domain-containing sensor histidine kinase [Chloroflexia bacterium]|nr:PAS domain-containing sensor histidine kinase [Chloroflexia bacterium]